MFKKYHNLIAIFYYFFSVVFLLIFSINAVWALDIPQWNQLKSGGFGLYDTANQSGFNISTTGDNVPTFANIIGDIVGIVLSLLGVIFMILIIYSGFLWMTARGNEENVQKAKTIMTNAVIGVAIIFAAYAITNFLINSLYTATTGA